MLLLSTCAISFSALIDVSEAATVNCSIDPSPIRPPDQKVTKNNLTSGFGLSALGLDGCGHDDPHDGNSGDPGFPGQPSANLSLTITNAIIPLSNGEQVRAITRGGEGGHGYNSHRDFGKVNTGGAGGVGGDGGSATVDFQGTLDSRTAGIQASGLGGNGGTGGSGLWAGVAKATRGGNGGLGGQGGGHVEAIASGRITSGGAAATAEAEGGFGGNGGLVTEFADDAFGGAGARGGDGGGAHVRAEGRLISIEDSGIKVQANGGMGGGGGFVKRSDAHATGGSGGEGGAGGEATTLVTGTAEVQSQQSADAGQVGVLVQANGGVGGTGGYANAARGEGGGGGYGGTGGTATATIQGKVKTIGDHAHGVLSQAVGGVGGDGNKAMGLFFSKGGEGLSGGPGGQATTHIDGGEIVVGGLGGAAVVTQSVGGGGGSGGNAKSVGFGAEVSIGGNGGSGGAGAGSTITIGEEGVLYSSSTMGGAGALSQSIGGAGGAGGSVTAAGYGTSFSLAIGGDGGPGSSADTASITNDGLVTTRGTHAPGLEAQSIGGGGGKGGSALAFSAGVGISSAVAIGGAGGEGGKAGGASITNSNQVMTFGSDAPGMQAQSVGGGGGNGGTAAATAVALSPDPDIPAFAVSVSLGGGGGTGNSGGDAGVANDGFVAAAGHGSFAVLGQSVGGGGGRGGDSSASSYAFGGDIDLTVSTAVGGPGGNGGLGGKVTVDNKGLLVTRGQDAHAVMGQSVGGSGGIGGHGDTSGTSGAGEKASVSLELGVGGSGGSGGDGGQVILNNYNGIATGGDGSDGVFGQSVGGGGGMGNGGVANANGKNLKLAVAVGGDGGAGGDGGDVDVISYAGAGIVTTGSDAIALTAQSVGGGGGRGGKGASETGGAPLNPADSFAEILERNLKPSEGTKKIVDGVVKFGDGALKDVKTIEKLSKLAKDEKEEGGKDKKKGKVPNLDVAISVGGKGGAAGDGALARATNSGAISTDGALAYGIYSQSVGGGGGIAGGATSTTGGEGSYQAAVAVGGKGGAGGDGGQAAATNLGSVETAGVSAFGVAAQSVGGGGGRGAHAGATNGSLKSLGLALGGDSGAGGKGGAVAVVSDGGSITTTGKHAIGAFAQSVGGGGGVLKTLSDDQTGDQSDNPGDEEPDKFRANLTIGGKNGAGSDGGEVQVYLQKGGGRAATLTTDGRNAHGVLAQSIGGGGGTAVGGTLWDKGGLEFARDGGEGGHGGLVDVTIRDRSSVSTAGDGAAGVWAQSIGGGGGIGGDAAGSTSAIIEFQQALRGKDSDGGEVDVTVDGGSVVTTGSNAPAIRAQSFGGGGMHVFTQNGVISGSAGGSGRAGPVGVTLKNGAVVSATGQGSHGIEAHSDGSAANEMTITVDGTSKVTGGAEAYAISLIEGAGNLIDNSGSIQAGPGGGAIFSNAFPQRTELLNTGHVSGDIVGVDTVQNRPDGLIETGALMDLGPSGDFLNYGTLSVGGIEELHETSLVGDFHNRDGGVLHFDLHENHDRMAIGGSLFAEYGSTVRFGSLFEELPKVGSLFDLIVGESLIFGDGEDSLWDFIESSFVSDRHWDLDLVSEPSSFSAAYSIFDFSSPEILRLSYTGPIVPIPLPGSLPLYLVVLVSGTALRWAKMRRN